MKKSKLIMILLFAVTFVMASAFSFEKEGVYFNKIARTHTPKAKVTFKTSSYKSYRDTVVIPDSVVFDGVTYKVTCIGFHAFEGSRELKEVKIPNTVKNIEDDAFMSCTGLVSITLPSSVETIGKRAFSRTKFTELKLPEGVKTIDETAFGYCTELQTVELPSTVTKIAPEAFSYDFALESFKVDPSNEKYCDVDGVLYDKTCESLICFPPAKGNEYEILPTTKSIQKAAFGWHSDLKKVVIPDSVRTIEEFAFFWCSSLRKAEMPHYLEKVGKCAFWGTLLKTAILPATIKEIGDEAFFYCTRFNSATILATTPPKIGKDAFPPAMEVLYVPAEALEAYKSAKGYEKYNIEAISR